ncbi:tol-pal system protein YbgF [Chelativorans sp. AA-79]|uniref:tol-pal system protein YbgF n=1 Tax=Chelativorans sp. AA-79 TaxID=3028735 RepID=UPI0023F6F606|nr:tol-pal system protein YbgF [Chelativorans sp. AA-79]WEX10001.1 tol-pal system protein YbgF [Chelativorans sp. AA-79]
MLSRNHLRGLAALTLFVAASVVPAAAFQLRSAPMPEQPVGAAGEARVVPVQATDPRLTGLEEEIRKLNGRIEELNFQILQMQDQMRRMQEDTEFRFQELEGGGQGSAGGEKPDQRTERLSPPPAEGGGQQAAAAADSATLPPAGVPQAPVPPAAGGNPPLGEPPRTLGTITFDENGNVVSGGAGQPIDLLQGTPAGQDGSVVAALPHSDNPEEIYQSAYQFILSGDYRTAEAGFRQYLDTFPEGEHAADAHFWLGEAMLGQDRYREAAEVFLQANRDFPDAVKAPEMLLKLGVSLTAMNQRDVACATYSEIGHRYPDISAALRGRVQQEQALAGC